MSDQWDVALPERRYPTGQPAAEKASAIEPMAKIYVVDDDAQVRTSLANLLRSVEFDVEAFASTDDFLRHQHIGVPSCLVLDIRFPGSARSGLDFQRHLRGSDFHIPIIFLTGHADVQMSIEAMKLGAIDFLTKPVREQTLLDAVRKAIERHRLWMQNDAALKSIRNRFKRLTVREREVMQHLIQGLLNKQIAAAVGLSEISVKVHRGRIMQKMEARSLIALARMGDKLHISDPASGAADPDR